MKKLLHVGCLLGLILVMILSGCGGGSKSKGGNGNGGSTPPGGPQPDPVVYAAGYYYKEGMEKPFYWTSKDAKPVSPSDGGVIYSIAYGNGQIYYGGYSKNIDPCFWTGNTMTSLGTDGEVKSMVYANGKLYCGGNYFDDGDFYPCYWIDNNKTPNKLSANKTDYLSTIVLANGVVYGGGYYYNSYYRPCYWKENDPRVELSPEWGGFTPVLLPTARFIWEEITGAPLATGR